MTQDVINKGDNMQKPISIIRGTPKKLIEALRYEYGRDYKRYVVKYSKIRAHGKLPKIYIARLKGII